MSLRSSHHYELIEAKPFLCVGASIEMILRSEGICIYDQVDISERLGVNIPPEDESSLLNVTRTIDKNRWGTVIENGVLNRLFEEISVPLYENYIHISTIHEAEFAVTLAKQITTGHHIICGFDYGVLFRDKQSTVGHVAIITAVSNEGNVELLDPGPDDSGIKTVNADLLYDAIRSKKDGLWIFMKK